MKGKLNYLPFGTSVNQNDTTLHEDFKFVRLPALYIDTPPLLRSLKRFYRWIRVVWRLSLCVREGWKEFRRTGNTPSYNYAMFIELFCETWGISNEVMHFFAKRLRPKVPIKTTHGILGDLHSRRLREVSKVIQSDGFFVFPNRLSSEMVDAIARRAMQKPATPDLPFPTNDVFYDPNKAIAPRYLQQNKYVITMPEAQEVFADPSFMALAQDYLGCMPVLDLALILRSTSVFKSPSAHSAQYYHFDMDRIRWLKYFIYLTDVTNETGPMSFVKGSHRPFGIPYEILRYHQSRLPDSFVSEFYSKDKFVQITGQKGTIIAFDSRGLHKGRHLESGERLVLQLEYANSLFGMKPDPVETSIHSNALLASMEKYPGVYEILHVSKQ